MSKTNQLIGPSMLNEHNFRVRRFVNPELLRPQLGNALKTDKETVASDGHTIVAVSIPTSKRQDNGGFVTKPAEFAKDWEAVIPPLEDATATITVNVDKLLKLVEFMQECCPGCGVTLRFYGEKKALRFDAITLDDNGDEYEGQRIRAALMPLNPAACRLPDETRPTEGEVA